MIFLKALYFLIIPILIGYFFIKAIIKKWQIHLKKTLLIFLSIGIGHGIVSIIFFLGLLIFNSCFAVIPIELSFLIFLIIYNKKYNLTVLTKKSKINNKEKFSYVILIIVSALILVSMINYFSNFLVAPHGQWDAWNVWNLRPRFIVRTGELHTSLSRDLADIHCTDYPMLIPSIIGRGWTIIGYEATWVSFCVSFMFFYSLVGVVIFSIKRFRGFNQGLLCGAALLISPEIIIHSANQYADLPLGYFITCAFSFLLLYDSEGCREFLFLSAFCAGLAAWTKNEGIVFAALFFFCRTGFIFFKDKKRIITEIKSLLLALLPFTIFILWFKIFSRNPNMFLKLLDWNVILERVSNVNRYILIIYEMVKEIIRILPSYNFPVLLLLYLILNGSDRIAEKIRPAYFSLLITLLLMLTVYFLSFLIIFQHLRMQIRIAFIRMLFQIWPSFLILFFLYLKKPFSKKI